MYLYIQDVMVLPVLQRSGLGTEIMKRVLRVVAADWPGARVALSCEPRISQFYRRLGFEQVDESFMRLTNVKTQSGCSDRAFREPRP